MSKEHVFFGKFLIKEKDGTDEYTVSAAPLSDKERDVLAGIVRCKDCRRASIGGARTDLGEPVMCRRINWPVSPEGFCAWGKRKEVAE